MIARCPACDATFSPRGRSTRAWVCACGCLLEESPEGAIVRGRPPRPEESYSGLSIGARGTFLGKGFTLLGRVRRSDGATEWNEWNAEFQDGTAGWLADTGADLAFFLAFPGATPPHAADLQLDAAFELGGRSYQVRDKRTVRNTGAEGEFAQAPDCAGTAQVLDLDGERDGFATLESGNGETRIFIGKQSDALGLGLSGTAAAGEALVLRPPAAGRPIVCAACGKTGSLLAGPRSRAWVCPICRTLHHSKQGKISKQGALPKWGGAAPVLRVGMRGVLRDTEWTVTGILRRVDKKSRFEWTEFALFNPFRGYRWLSEANGHWSFGTRAAGPVKTVLDKAEYGGRSFALFTRGTALAKNAEGEFTWALKMGEGRAMSDYIDPPLMLTKEGAGGESNWTCNEYLDPEEVRRAFGPQHMPPRLGVAPNQPSPWGGQASRWVGISVACACLVLALQILAGISSDQRAWRGEGALPADTTVLSEAFEVAGGPQAVSITLYSEVDNDWLELRGELIDSARGSRRAFEIGSEHWRGYTDGEYWAEGERIATVTLSSLPDGRYRLLGHASMGQAQSFPVRYTVEVKRNASFLSDFWITMAILAAAAGFVTWRRFDFERERWLLGDGAPWEKGMA